MKLLQTLLVTCVTALAGLARAQAPAALPAPEEFVFQFRPPAGTRVSTVYRLQRSRSVEGRPPVSDEAESTTEGLFTPLAGGGYTFAQKTLAVAMRRNGQPVDDPVLGLLAKVQPTFTVSADGEVTQITGFGEVEAVLKATMPPALAAALAPVLNEAALVGRERAEWNGRYAEFAGGRFRIGESIRTTAPQPLPNGQTLTYTVVTSFPRWEPCPAGACVRIEQVYESDAAALGELAAGISQRLAAAASAPGAQLPAVSAPGARLAGSLSRLIDPHTMLIYAERLERRLTMQVQGAGEGTAPMTQHEIRTYEHSYERP